MQLSTTITILLAIVVVFCFYGVILAKFYKRRRRVDTLNQVQYSTARYSTTQYTVHISQDVETEFQPKLRTIRFSRITSNWIPIQRMLKVSPDEESKTSG